MKGSSIIHLIQRKIKFQNITLINIEIYYIHVQNIFRTINNHSKDKPYNNWRPWLNLNIIILNFNINHWLLH